MELDERIEKLSDIFNCFNAEKAKQFIGQKGYFANDLNYFSNIHSCYYDTLAEVKDRDRPFKDEDCCPWSFFIPESFLKPKEKKYRPYTIEEFQSIFTVGVPIRFRYKRDKSKIFSLFLGYTIGNGNVFIEIGHGTYDLEELLENYEWQRVNTEEYVPFGVEE